MNSLISLEVFRVLAIKTEQENWLAQNPFIYKLQLGKSTDLSLLCIWIVQYRTARKNLNPSRPQQSFLFEIGYMHHALATAANIPMGSEIPGHFWSRLTPRTSPALSFD